MGKPVGPQSTAFQATKPTVPRRVVERLHALASHYDTVTENVFINQRHQLKATFPTDTITTLAQLIDRYCFDETAVLLEHMQEQLHKHFIQP